ncbi:hypothetical protein Francci3_3468 [Frankia casuarinae]|uniref:Uncharacterized protein n=1 Tax=Frankia casuarinae (strain DSM 45818 / CECT 9043 / HFP020203 / CcI3) TaxID=106370 RepID=Q2J7C0_FRACC|nr:hypothetical protein Francci3_3468 [Frankia casuarinae]
MRHLPNRANPHHPPQTRPAGRRPPRGHRPGLAGRVPPLAPPVERGIAWLTAHGNRRVPYRGVARNDSWLHHRAAAPNLRRLVNLGLTRTSDNSWIPTTAAAEQDFP